MNSHLETLENLFKFYPAKKILEFGTGEFSTTLFSKYADIVISIEQQDLSWVNTAKEIANDNVLFFFIPQTQDRKNLKEFLSLNKFDLIFIDGIDRDACLDFSLDLTGLIGMHDSQSWWQNGKAPLQRQNELWHAWSNLGNPATSFIAKDKSILENLARHMPQGSFIGDNK